MRKANYNTSRNWLKKLAYALIPCATFSLLTIKATVSVTVDDHLIIVNNSLPESGVLTISRGSSAPFSLKLRPRAIGQLTVSVSAVGDGGERDTVRKLLNVKVLIYFQLSVKKNGKAR